MGNLPFEDIEQDIIIKSFSELLNNNICVINGVEVTGINRIEQRVSVKGIDEIVVYGVATDICVDLAIMGMIKRGKKVYAVIDAMRGLDKRNADRVIKTWKEKGVRIIKTEDVLRGLIT